MHYCRLNTSFSPRYTLSSPHEPEHSIIPVSSLRNKNIVRVEWLPPLVVERLPQIAFITDTVLFDRSETATAATESQLRFIPSSQKS